MREAVGPAPSARSAAAGLPAHDLAEQRADPQRIEAAERLAAAGGHRAGRAVRRLPRRRARPPRAGYGTGRRRCRRSTPRSPSGDAADAGGARAARRRAGRPRAAGGDGAPLCRRLAALHAAALAPAAGAVRLRAAAARRRRVRRAPRGAGRRGPRPTPSLAGAVPAPTSPAAPADDLTAAAVAGAGGARAGRRPRSAPRAMLDEGRPGQALLARLARVRRGRGPDPAALRAALLVLRRAGQTEAARHARAADLLLSERG